MRIFCFLIAVLLFPCCSPAQTTHCFSNAIGVSNAVYRHTLPGGKSYASLFLVTSGGDYQRIGDGAIWVGAGFGFTVRQIPFYREWSDFKTGVQLAEHWVRFRGGLKLAGEKTTHLPFVSLGIARYRDETLFEKQAGHTLTYLVHRGSWSKQWQPFPPFVEIGNQLLRSDFTEKRSCLTLSMALRYYPLPMFRQPVSFEYDLNKFAVVQYHLVELNVMAGVQFNRSRRR